MKRKKSRKQYSAEERAYILEEVARRKLGITEAARHYRVNAKTLATWRARAKKAKRLVPTPKEFRDMARKVRANIASRGASELFALDGKIAPGNLNPGIVAGLDLRGVRERIRSKIDAMIREAIAEAFGEKA